MWLRVRQVLIDGWRWLRRGRNERRTAEARARFWADVREGEREAKIRAGS